MSVRTTLVEILKERGALLNTFQQGAKDSEKFVDREIKKQPTPRVNRLLDLYYATLSSIDGVSPTFPT